jgi:alcohol dehydrogenase class IV
MSAPWSFQSAGTLVFGRDSVNQLGDIAGRLKAKRVLVVTDAVLVKAGIADRVVKPLAESGAAVEVFSGCLPEPPVEVIRAAADAARAFKPDVLVGLGGGSNMDAAKLVAVLLAHGGDPTDWVGDSRVPGPVFPLVCVPTTAGTGSEVSAAAVFTDTANKIKVSTLSPFLRPTYAVVDPLLTVGCPKQVTADSGIDALTHAVEAYTAAGQDEFVRRPGGATVYQGKNPLADMMAVECIQLVGRFLRRAVNNPNDLEARDGMAMAATLGGLAFSNAGVALVHAMEYPVGGAVHVSHGAGNGLLLPFVMRYNAAVRADEVGQIGLWLDGPAALAGDTGTPTERVRAYFDDAVNQSISAVEQLRKDIGIPTRLRDIGVTEDMLPGFAEKAFGIKRLMRVNPRVPQSAAEILEIYRAAF